jgi:hypothetical protein
MKKVFFFTLLISLLSGLAYFTSGQNIDLVKLKKEEEKRRAKLKKSKYGVITNENINQIKFPDRPYGFAKMEITGGPKTENNKKPIKKPPIDKKETKEYWQDLKRKITSGIKKEDKNINNNQLRLNKLMFEFPAEDRVYERKRMQIEMENVRKALERSKRNLASLKNQLDGLYDEARRAGAPPGWLR